MNVESEPMRESMVSNAAKRLETLAEESDALVEKLNGVFSSVLFHGPATADAVPDCEPLPGSDLGLHLTGVAERIERNFNTIRNIIRSSDL